MKPLTPYQKIRRAVGRPSGLRLTLDDVHILWGDDAIRYRAEQDDYEHGVTSPITNTRPDPRRGSI